MYYFNDMNHLNTNQVNNDEAKNLTYHTSMYCYRKGAS